MIVSGQIHIENLPRPDATIPQKRMLYTSLWIEVSFEEEMRHKDGTITIEKLRLTCTPFPWVYVNIVNLKAVRELCRELLMFLDWRDLKEFPPKK